MAISTTNVEEDIAKSILCNRRTCIMQKTMQRYRTHKKTEEKVEKTAQRMGTQGMRCGLDLNIVIKVLLIEIETIA